MEARSCIGLTASLPTQGHAGLAVFKTGLR
jgi:hypothetical protein